MKDFSEKFEAIRQKFLVLEEQLADPAVIADQERYARLGKEYNKLKELVEAWDRYRELEGRLAEARALVRDEDAEMREMARAEVEELEPRLEAMAEQLRLMLIPKDPDDEKDVIFEIRAGTGGDEAALFAGDLYRMYTRYFDRQGWQWEELYANEGAVGGYNKVVLEVRGEDVYGKLKFESGAHRVQRVPRTESQGRIHTSAATVAVMPRREMSDVHINPADLKIDTFRSSGAGGQHVNKTESAVRITHLPTGVVAESQDGRSQIRNREIAMQRLYQKLHEMQVARHQSELAARRKSLVGTGDRSDKIRTYNFPQNRVTDHRINLTLYSLDKVLEGQLDEIIEALQMAENAERLKAEEEAGR